VSKVSRFLSCSDSEGQHVSLCEGALQRKFILLCRHGFYSTFSYLLFQKSLWYIEICSEDILSVFNCREEVIIMLLTSNAKGMRWWQNNIHHSNCVEKRTNIWL